MNIKLNAGWLTAAELIAAAGAILLASCCVLPLVLGGLGAGAGLFSVLEVVAYYRAAILMFSLVVVLAACVVYFRRHGALSTALALIVATVFVGTARHGIAWKRLFLKS